MDKNHAARVDQLTEQVKDYYARSVPFRVYHGSSNATRVKTYKRSEMVDVSNLDQVLSIDVERKLVLAEPNVSMEKLLEATLKHGLMPPVVPEFPGITVGGAIQGGAIESGSFRWGAFGQTVSGMEMVLGNGEVVSVSPKERADLFYATAGSYGSLGLITAAEIRLIPAKKYVQLTSMPVTSIQQAVTLTQEYAQTSCDFIECGIFAKDKGCINIGQLSDSIAGELQRFTRPHDPYYYLYLRDHIKASEPTVFTVPLRDYLFRFDRGAFWAAEAAFQNARLPFNRFTRFILDARLHTRTLYKIVQATAAAQQFVCQDIVLPGDKVADFMTYIYDKFGEFPSGWVAVKSEPRSKLQFNAIPDTELVFNVGVYGPRIREYEEFVKVNRDIEQQVTARNGRKWFYAHSYYTPDEFWDIYDKRWYDRIRTKYHATRLPDIYNRIQTKRQHVKSLRVAGIKALLGIEVSRVKD